MGATDRGQYEYQRFLVMSIKAETAARGWALNELAARAGIDYQSLLRKLNLKRHFLMGEVDQIAAALGMRTSELAADAEARRDREPPNPGIHPDDAAVVDSANKLTKRQQAQVKRALTDGQSDLTQMARKRTPGESVGSSVRRPRTAG